MVLRRRLFQIAVGIGAAVGGWRFWSNEFDLEDVYLEATKQGDRPRNEWILHQVFKRMEWSDDHELKMEIGSPESAENISMASPDVVESADKHIDYLRPGKHILHFIPDIGVYEYELDALQKMADREEIPEPGKYTFIAFVGTTVGDYVESVDRILDEVTFKIEPDLSVASASTNGDGTVTVEVENSGNAPAMATQFSGPDGTSPAAGERPVVGIDGGTVTSAQPVGSGEVEVQFVPNVTVTATV